MINEFIYRYGKRLYGLCLTLCADRHEADDLYQDTWLRAVENIERYDKSRPFEPWITRICVNIYRNRLRRIMKSPIFDNFKTDEEKKAVLEGIAEQEAEDYSELYFAIDRLPEKLRITIILFYFQDMDIASAANALGVPVGTVKSRLNKARKILKEVLTDETDIQL